MCQPQWKHPNLTLKFHIVCFALSQATNRYIKKEMKRLIVITLLGKLNEHIYIEWTRRLDYCLKSPWWHFILVSPQDVSDIFVFLVGMQMKKKYQGKLQHCAKWYLWNYSAAYNSWTFKIQCAYILPSQFIILSFDLWYTSFNFLIRVYITPLSFRENKIWSTY